MERAWALESDRGGFAWQSLRGIPLPGGCVTLASSSTSLNFVFFSISPKEVMPPDSLCGDENAGKKHQGTRMSAVWRAYTGLVSFTGWALGADAYLHRAEAQLRPRAWGWNLGRWLG